MTAGRKSFSFRVVPFADCRPTLYGVEVMEEGLEELGWILLPAGVDGTSGPLVSPSRDLLRRFFIECGHTEAESE